MMGVWVFFGAGIAALSWTSRWLYLRTRKSKSTELPPTQNTSIVAGNDTQANSLAIEAGATASAPVVVEPNNISVTVFASQSDIPVRKPTEPTPFEIRKAQEAVPDFQQEDFLKTFSGMKVSWPLVVVSVSKLEEEFCILVLKYSVPGVKLMVGCLVRVMDYPIVKAVQPGHKVWATGEIHTITVNSILLKDVVLEFDTPTDVRMAEAAHKGKGRVLVTTVEPSDGNLFERKLLERADGTLIESRCKHCGQILLGKAIFGDLLEQEQQHMVDCGRE
jgi:hypothetical protein